MPTGVVSLEKLQLGIESEAGTIVAADTVLPVENGGEFEPVIDRQHLDEAQGVRAMVDHLDVSKGSVIRYRHSLDFENILFPLSCGLKQVTPVDNMDGTYTHTYNPDPTAVETLDSATFEFSYTDGSTRHLQREIGFGTCRRMVIDINGNQPAMIETEWFGRKSQTSTFTASQSPLTANKIPSNLFAVYIDASWANLGTTKKSGLVRRARLEVTTGRAPDYTLDARSDLDMTQLQSGEDIAGTLTLSCEYNADGDTEYDNWEAGESGIRFVQLIATDGTRTLEIDLALRLTGVRPTEEDGLRMLELTGELVYDPTSTEQINFVVTNGIASI